jgi:hypothetical protein
MLIICASYEYYKYKPVPLHAMETLGGGEEIKLLLMLDLDTGWR